MKRRPGSRQGTVSERGQVAGIEALPFGVLVFVVVTLLIANTWAVLDARRLAAEAAREATRAVVEAADEHDAVTAALERAEAVMAAGGRPEPVRTSVRFEDGFQRCGRVEVEVSTEVPALVLPWIRAGGSAIAVTARYSELIDPYRDGLPSGGC